MASLRGGDLVFGRHGDIGQRPCRCDDRRLYDSVVYLSRDACRTNLYLTVLFVHAVRRSRFYAYGRRSLTAGSTIHQVQSTQ